MARDGFFGVFVVFVFEHKVASVTRVLQDACDAGEVGWFFFSRWVGPARGDARPPACP